MNVEWVQSERAWNLITKIALPWYNYMPHWQCCPLPKCHSWSSHAPSKQIPPTLPAHLGINYVARKHAGACRAQLCVQPSKLTLTAISLHIRCIQKWTLKLSVSWIPEFWPGEPWPGHTKSLQQESITAKECWALIMHNAIFHRKLLTDPLWTTELFWG